MIALNPQRSEGHVLAYAMFKWEPFGRQLVELLDSSFFTDPFYVAVFNCLQEGAEMLHPDAIISVVHDRVGDFQSLRRLISDHCNHGEHTRTHFRYHLGQLRLARAERRMSDLGASLAGNLEEGNLDVSEIREACDDIERLAVEDDAPARGVMDFVARLTDGTPPKQSELGMTALDDRVGGLRAGDMLILGGTPGTGKTSLALHTARLNLRRDRGVMIASYEMRTEDLWYRILSSETRIPLKHFFNRTLSTDERREVAEVASITDQWPLEIINPKIRTVGVLESLVAARHAKEPLSLLIVDYLQLLQAKGNKGSRYEQVSEISSGLKQLAMNLEIPVMVLCQLNREAAKDKPRIHHLRDSGQIEQDADTILLLRKEEGDLVLIQVEKARRGRAGAETAMHFDGTTQTWSEPNRVTDFDDFNEGG